jgi:hypothetical protein
MRSLAWSASVALALVASAAQADEPKPAAPAVSQTPMPMTAESAPGGESTLTPEQIHLSSDTETPKSTLPEAPAEAPPPLPHHKGLVAEGALGAIGFLGQFRHVAPMGPMYRMQLGYEFLKWLMLFGEGELAFTSTDVAQDESHSYAFPIFGFGGGLRVTIHPTDRVAFYVQGSIDAAKADVPTGALQVLGYRNAESLSPAFAARAGVEWYQIDRHMALGLVLGIQDATGFAKASSSADMGLMADASGVIRYTF